MAFEYDPQPAFCPFTGKQCPSVKEDCLDGACLEYWTEKDKETPPGKVKMCLHHRTCLLAVVEDCTGTLEESERRGCNSPFLIVDSEGFVLDEGEDE